MARASRNQAGGLRFRWGGEMFDERMQFCLVLRRSGRKIDANLVPIVPLYDASDRAVTLNQIGFGKTNEDEELGVGLDGFRRSAQEPVFADVDTGRIYEPLFPKGTLDHLLNLELIGAVPGKASLFTHGNTISQRDADRKQWGAVGCDSVL